MLFRLSAPLALAAALAVALSHPLSARQDVDDASEWNDARVLELVDRGRQIRSEQMTDTALQTYQSRANAYIYFYIDRPDEDDRTLIKADQLALDVFWGTPDRTRQRIVGRRDQDALPTNIKYHLDHLTVVQDEFGDVIRLGDGDEVEAVAHPIGTAGPATYDYRLGTPVTITTGGPWDPVRVDEVLVRPKNADAPGFVGAVYLERDTGAIVRMQFTFTSSSYVDPYLDYIRISLDNSLWDGEWWLPYRQELEVRREMPVIDFLAGSVIRGRFEIGDYMFNVGFDERFFEGPAITQLPADRLESFEFEDGLLDDLDRQGLGPTPGIDEIEDRVREVGMQQALDGLNPLRLHWGSVSDGVRYNRFEGWVLGLGSSVDLGDIRLRALGAWAFGAEEFQARASIARPVGEGRLTLTGRLNGSRDVGPFRASTPIFNSISTLWGRDFTDLYRVSGVDVVWEGPLFGTEVELGAGFREEGRRGVVIDDPESFRPAIDALSLQRWALEAGVEEEVGRSGTLSVGADVGLLDPADAVLDNLVAGGLTVDLVSRTPEYRPGRYLEGRLAGGIRFGDLVAQDLSYFGGRGTLPGFEFRDRAGDRFLMAEGRVGTVLSDPFLAVHLVGALGWSGAVTPEAIGGALRYPVIPGEEGWRMSVGAGVDLMWRVLRMDLMRGLGDDGTWELVVSIRPDLAQFM